MGRDDRNKLRNELEPLLKIEDFQSGYLNEWRVASVIGVLVKSVLTLDESNERVARSSERLWKVNVGLTVVVLLIGIFQVVLMVRRH